MKKFGHVEQPVVMDKPSHHREVESFHVPGDEAGYYKAYEGDKMVLVPKENLEAMKELVNYKMRRRAESKFTHFPDHAQEEKELERFQHKLEHLQHKMEEYEETQLEPLLREYERENILVEAEHRFKKSEVTVTFKMTEGSIKPLPLQSIDKSNEKTPSDAKSMSEEISLPRGSIPDTQSIKFLVSGHFRNNKRPIFIIRQYRGSSVIGSKLSDFNSIKHEKDVDILISGKFYKESILEEKNEKLKNMKFKAHKKILIDGRSNILEEGFIEMFSICEFDVVVGGMFIKQPSSAHYTPLVSIAIKRLRPSNSREGRGIKFPPSEKEETVMSLSAPVVQNPFIQDLRKTRSDPKSGIRRKRKASPVDYETPGFRSLLTRIDEGEEAFECPSHQRPRSRSSSKNSTSTQNSFIKTVDKPRVNFTLSRIFSIDYFSFFKKKERAADEEGWKSLSTKSTRVASLEPIRPRVVKTEYISLASTSGNKTLKTTENNLIVPSNPPKPKDAKFKSSKKPGFFKRIFKRLFSRQ